jgi:holo-[acyl-carrier protein] synthase
MRAMALRVGIDLVSIASVQESLQAHADHYLSHVYTDAEVRDCQTSDGIDAARLAARFAAKEAALKALRPTSEDAVPWNTIEVHRDSTGWTSLILSGAAAALAEAAGVTEFALSLTHEDKYASAIVVAECLV